MRRDELRCEVGGAEQHALAGEERDRRFSAHGDHGIGPGILQEGVGHRPPGGRLGVARAEGGDAARVTAMALGEEAGERRGIGRVRGTEFEGIHGGTFRSGSGKRVKGWGWFSLFRPCFGYVTF